MSPGAAELQMRPSHYPFQPPEEKAMGMTERHSTAGHSPEVSSHLAEALQHLEVRGVVAVREVQADDVQACVQQPVE